MSDLPLGRTLRGLRLRDGLTQRQAAKWLDVEHVHLSKVEAGRVKPDAQLVEDAADLYAVDMIGLAHLRRLYDEWEPAPPATGTTICTGRITQ